MAKALTMDMLATDIADYLVRKGVRLFLFRPTSSQFTMHITDE
jgi:hypothetical protein